MKTNYKIGRRLEYKIIKILKEALDSEKYTVIRTAGSHSPVDVYVIEHRTKQGFGIQCKSKLKTKEFIKESRKALNIEEKQICVVCKGEFKESELTRCDEGWDYFICDECKFKVS